MFDGVKRRFRSFWRKNGPELQAIFSRELNNYISPSEAKRDEQNIPVFCFHSVQPDRFETQLKYLAENNYTTVNANTLLDMLQSGNSNFDQTKSIALTFDDATGSFWATAYPLLKKYNFQAILFIAPALISDDNQSFPTLFDYWAGKSSIESITSRETDNPVCTWNELITMHESNVVDIQSHSLTHSLIFTSPNIIDFLNPKFDSYFFKNVNVPIACNDDSKKPQRQINFGSPIYENTPRLEGKQRFIEDIHISQDLIKFVRDNHKEMFFKQILWRYRLTKKFKELKKHHKFPPTYETIEEMRDAIRFECQESKEIIKKKLGGKTIDHLCYPWFKGSDIADKIAADCGYKAVHYGLINSVTRKKATSPQKIRRISEDFLFCLPGNTQMTIAQVYWQKIALKYLEKAGPNVK